MATDQRAADAQMIRFTNWTRVLAIERRPVAYVHKSMGVAYRRVPSAAREQRKTAQEREKLVDGELTHWLANAGADRRLTRDLAQQGRRTVRAQEEVMAIGQVTRDAIDEATLTSLECDQAERISPSGAGDYRLLACTGTVEMVQSIRSVRRGR